MYIDVTACIVGVRHGLETILLKEAIYRYDCSCKVHNILPNIKTRVLFCLITFAKFNFMLTFKGLHEHI